MSSRKRQPAAWAVIEDDEVIRVEPHRYLCRDFVSIQSDPGLDLRVVPLFREARLSQEVRRVLKAIAARERDVNSANVIREFLRRA